MLGKTIFASAEIRPDREPIVGPKIGCWAGGGAAAGAMGLSAIYYTDFNKGTWRLRPELGLGLDKFKLVYGYNIALTNKSFDKINTNNFSIAILLRLKKIKAAKK